MSEQHSDTFISYPSSICRSYSFLLSIQAPLTQDWVEENLRFTEETFSIKRMYLRLSEIICRRFVWPFVPPASTLILDFSRSGELFAFCCWDSSSATFNSANWKACITELHRSLWPNFLSWSRNCSFLPRVNVKVKSSLKFPRSLSICLEAGTGRNPPSKSEDSVCWLRFSTIICAPTYNTIQQDSRIWQDIHLWLSWKGWKRPRWHATSSQAETSSNI